MSVFVLPVRVYYEDTDHGGVVYYANYLKFMERCRTDYLRHQGIEQDVLISEHNLIFAVRRVEADYLFPAKFNDLLLVTAEIIQKSRVKIVFKQQIFRKKVCDEELPSMNGYFESTKQKVAEPKTAENILLCESEITVIP